MNSPGHAVDGRPKSSKCLNFNLAATVEQLVTVRSRRSMYSPGHAVDGRPKSSKFSGKVVTI